MSKNYEITKVFIEKINSEKGKVKYTVIDLKTRKRCAKDSFDTIKDVKQFCKKVSNNYNKFIIVPYNKKIIEGKIDAENTDTEDSGQSLITTMEFRDTPEDEDNGMFVRIQSWMKIVNIQILKNLKVVKSV